MSDKAVEELFYALFKLTDLRCILREIKPTYQLNDKQREEIRDIVSKVQRSLLVIEKELLG